VRGRGWLAAALLLVNLASAARADPLDEAFDHLEAGHYAAALEAFDRLAAQHPKSAIPLYYAGLAATGLDAREEALARFRLAAGLEPDYPGLQLRLGAALYESGDLEAAEPHLLNALIEGPETGELLYILALIDLEHGQDARAQRLFNQAVQLEPTLREPADEAIAIYTRDADLQPSMRPGTESEADAHSRWRVPPWFAASAGAGIEWDDNLVVPETQIATGMQDFAGVFDLSLDVFPFSHQGSDEMPDGTAPGSTPGSTGVTLGYDFYQSLYHEVKGLDAQSHGLRAGGFAAWRRYRARFGYGYTHDRLGQNPYLAAHRLTGGVETRLTPSWFADLAASFEFQDFADFSERDALRWSLSFGQRLDLWEGRVSTFLAYVPEWQEARADRLDYFAHQLDVNTSVYLNRPHAGLSLRIGYAYEARGYHNVEPLLVDRKREDRIHRVRTGLTVPLVWHVEAMLDYSFVSSRSNLNVLDYSENVVSFRIGAWL
jgi:hypothetical protein